MRFVVSAVVLLKIQAFWDFTPCRLLHSYQAICRNIAEDLNCQSAEILYANSEVKLFYHVVVNM